MASANNHGLLGQRYGLWTSTGCMSCVGNRWKPDVTGFNKEKINLWGSNFSVGHSRNCWAKSSRWSFRNLLKSGIQSVHNLPVRIAQPISTELEVVVLHWARKCWNLFARSRLAEGNIRRRGSNQHWFPCKFNNFNVFWGPKIWYTNLETHPCREL